MGKAILSIGCKRLESICNNASLYSDQSLLDADIIVFSTEDLFEDSTANELWHWKKEFEQALELGKTIFYLFHKGIELIEDRQISFDEIRKVHHISHELMPIEVGTIVNKGGKVIILDQATGPFSEYWNDLQKCSFYEAYIEDAINHNKRLFKTRSGNKTIGAVYQIGRGHFVLLPPWETESDPNPDLLLIDDSTEFDNMTRKIVDHLVRIHEYLQSNCQKTPIPAWATESVTENERKILSEMAATEIKIKDLQNQMADFGRSLDNELAWKDLLFEQGAPLERAVNSALKLLGFIAEPYKNDESEFDVVFSSSEGRCLGEIEGKDTKAINIDKFRQLVTNIDEDFERGNHDDYAKGVLFGNAFRLINPILRESEFTEKCLKGSKKYSYALVKTSDLYPLVCYLTMNDDEDFKKNCRVAILTTENGIVQFPTPPAQ